MGLVALGDEALGPGVADPPVTPFGVAGAEPPALGALDTGFVVTPGVVGAGFWLGELVPLPEPAWTGDDCATSGGGPEAGGGVLCGGSGVEGFAAAAPAAPATASPVIGLAAFGAEPPALGTGSWLVELVPLPEPDWVGGDCATSGGGPESGGGVLCGDSGVERSAVPAGVEVLLLPPPPSVTTDATAPPAAPAATSVRMALLPPLGAAAAWLFCDPSAVWPLRAARSRISPA